jgi:hemerythrin
MIGKHGGATHHSGATEALNEFRAPVPLPTGPLEDDRLRAELVDLKARLCRDLTYAAGIILNTGILSAVPARIQELTGMRVDELEALETRACIDTGSSAAATSLGSRDLLQEVRTIQWLVTIHLAAMAEVTEQAPRLRPINAEGSFADFFRLHDVLVGELRRMATAMRKDPGIAAARELAGFWREVILPHAEAEDRTLWPLARSQQDEGLTRSADLLDAEHRDIDEKVAAFVRTLERVEQGAAAAGELAAIGSEIRARVELHFAKEEESVVRLLQRRVDDAAFRPVVAEQEATIGGWLAAHGWDLSAA